MTQFFYLNTSKCPQMALLLKATYSSQPKALTCRPLSLFKICLKRTCCPPSRAARGRAGGRRLVTPGRVRSWPSAQGASRFQVTHHLPWAPRAPGGVLGFSPPQNAPPADATHHKQKKAWPGQHSQTPLPPLTLPWGLWAHHPAASAKPASRVAQGCTEGLREDSGWDRDPPHATGRPGEDCG